MTRPALSEPLARRWSTLYISELAAATYEGFYLWVAGVKAAGSLDRMKVIEALEVGVSFDGPSGKVVLDHATHHATRNAYLAVVKDKKWSVIETYEAQSRSIPQASAT
jgi:urea transport system substrate-binding protein